MRFAIVLLLLTSCGFEALYDPRTIHGIDPAAAPYVATFEAKAGASIGDIPVGLTTNIQAEAGVSGDVVGVCVIWNSSNGPFKEVLLDYNFFHAQNDAGRTSLIWHELGHCYLNRAHNPQVVSGTTDANDVNYPDSGEAPESWMYPYIWFTQYAYLTEDTLLIDYENEMFDRSDFIPLSYEQIKRAAAGHNDWIVK